MDKNLFLEKFFTILIYVLNQNISYEIKKEFYIFHRYAENRIEGYTCDIDKLTYFKNISQNITIEAILSNLLFLYKYEPLFKTYYLEIRNKETNNIIIHWYKNSDIKLFIQKLEELAPHLYDVIYLSWNEVKIDV